MPWPSILSELQVNPQTGQIATHFSMPVVSTLTICQRGDDGSTIVDELEVEGTIEYTNFSRLELRSRASTWLIMEYQDDDSYALAGLRVDAAQTGGVALQYDRY